MRDRMFMFHSILLQLAALKSINHQLSTINFCPRVKTSLSSNNIRVPSPGNSAKIINFLKNPLTNQAILALVTQSDSPALLSSPR